MMASNEKRLDSGPEQLQIKGIYEDAINQKIKWSSPGLTFKFDICHVALFKNEL